MQVLFFHSVHTSTVRYVSVLFLFSFILFYSHKFSPAYSDEVFTTSIMLCVRLAVVVCTASSGGVYS